MVFLFWRILAFLLAKRSAEACLPVSHPGSGQVLPTLALLLPKELLNSVPGATAFLTHAHGDGGQEPSLLNLRVA